MHALRYEEYTTLVALYCDLYKPKDLQVHPFASHISE